MGCVHAPDDSDLFAMKVVRSGLWCLGMTVRAIPANHFVLNASGFGKVTGTPSALQSFAAHRRWRNLYNIY